MMSRENELLTLATSLTGENSPEGKDAIARRVTLHAGKLAGAGGGDAVMALLVGTIVDTAAQMAVQVRELERMDQETDDYRARLEHEADYVEELERVMRAVLTPAQKEALATFAADDQMTFPEASFAAHEI